MRVCDFGLNGALTLTSVRVGLRWPNGILGLGEEIKLKGGKQW